MPSSDYERPLNGKGTTSGLIPNWKQHLKSVGKDSHSGSREPAMGGLKTLMLSPRNPNSSHQNNKT
jgi:hypothetical protein